MSIVGAVVGVGGMVCSCALIFYPRLFSLYPRLFRRYSDLYQPIFQHNLATSRVRIGVGVLGLFLFSAMAYVFGSIVFHLIWKSNSELYYGSSLLQILAAGPLVRRVPDLPRNLASIRVPEALDFQCQFQMNAGWALECKSNQHSKYQDGLLRMAKWQMCLNYGMDPTISAMRPSYKPDNSCSTRLSKENNADQCG
jgi:hypothetical protein